VNDYDQAARYATRRLEAAGCLAWQTSEARVGKLRGVLGPGWSFDDWVDSQAVPYPGEPDRRCDTVARFLRRELDAPPLALVVEFLVEARPAVMPRQAQYQLAIHEGILYQRDPTVRYDVAGLIVNLTGTMSGRWGMMPKDTKGLALSLSVGVLDLEKVDARVVLKRIALGEVSWCVLAWVVLMAGAKNPKVLEEWIRLANLVEDEAKRGDLGGLARTFSALVPHGLLWRQALEGWNVQRSPYIVEVEQRAVLRNQRSNVLEFLSDGLGGSVPEELQQVVAAQTDMATLRRWLKQARNVTTLEQARTALDLPAQG
jgi:hypothetical protein